MIKMEVGKSYSRYKNGPLFKCIALDEDGRPILRNPASTEIFYPSLDVYDYIEYKEPKRGTVWVNVYDNKTDAGFSSYGYTSKAKADGGAMPHRVACIEVPWVEGQGI